MVPRREVDEWLAAVEVGRAVRYTVVEGPSDSAILSCMADDPFKSELVQISELEIPLQQLGHALLGGHKARLWELGMKVDDAGLLNALCFVDRDFDDLYACVPRPLTVVFADFANLPCGFCDYPFISGFLLRTYQVNLTAEHWAELCSIFRRLFAFRYWKATNAPAVAMVDPAPSLSQADLIPGMNWDNFFARAVAEGLLVSAADLQAQVTEIEELTPADARSAMHSDDLFSLIFRYLRLIKKIPNQVSKGMVRSALLGAMAQPRADQTTLTDLVEWLNGRANVAP